jgi:hypothetical protein
MGTALHHEMTIPPDQLEAELLRLPREERARLAELLAASVDREVAAWWEDEIDCRYQGYLRGEIEAVDAREALAALHVRFSGRSKTERRRVGGVHKVDGVR